MKTVFKVIGYEIKDPQGNFLETCIVWVFAKNAKEALKKTKDKGVEKKHWEIIEIIEK
jgi:hypothetical protein